MFSGPPLFAHLSTNNLAEVSRIKVPISSWQAKLKIKGQWHFTWINVSQKVSVKLNKILISVILELFLSHELIQIHLHRALYLAANRVQNHFNLFRHNHQWKTFSALTFTSWRHQALVFSVVSVLHFCRVQSGRWNTTDSLQILYNKAKPHPNLGKETNRFGTQYTGIER